MSDRVTVPVMFRLSTSFLQICKYDIAESISREMSGDLEGAMLAIGKVYNS